MSFKEFWLPDTEQTIMQLSLDCAKCLETSSSVFQQNISFKVFSSKEATLINELPWSIV